MLLTTLVKWSPGGQSLTLSERETVIWSCCVQEYSVRLTKGERGLGFTIAGGTNSVGYFYVKDVLCEPAKSHGEIHTGDRLVRVSGMSFSH